MTHADCAAPRQPGGAGQGVQAGRDGDLAVIAPGGNSPGSRVRYGSVDRRLEPFGEADACQWPPGSRALHDRPAGASGRLKAGNGWTNRYRRGQGG